MTLREMLNRGAQEFNIELSIEQTDACLVYQVELEKWNRKINLTAIRDERDIVVKHFIDSFSYTKGFIHNPGTKLLDMGSGAGFPALPIKIAFSDISVTLVEPVQKKVSFLRHVIRTLKLVDVAVLDKRTNELPSTYDEKFDVVTARAFADMDTALKEGSRFLSSGGVMVLSRGPEETISGAVLDKHGFVIENRFDLVLPLSDHRRSMWTLRRSSSFNADNI